MKRTGNSRGFSLLEALTALAVLSIILSSLMDTYSTGLRGANVTQERAGATILARSLLAEVTAGETIITGRRDGRNSNFSWRVDTGLLETVVPEDKKDSLRWGLYRIRIIVMKGSSVLSSLETVKIGKVRA